jgi:hypothetical protein
VPVAESARRGNWLGKCPIPIGPTETETAFEEREYKEILSYVGAHVTGVALAGKCFGEGARSHDLRTLNE